MKPLRSGRTGPRCLRRAWLATAALLALLQVAAPARADDAFAEAAEAFREGEYAEALRMLRAPAGAGHAEAQEMLGFLHAYGESFFPGIERDWREAMRWFEQAARHGRPGARYMHCVLKHRVAGDAIANGQCVDGVASFGEPAPAGAEAERSASAAAD